MNLIYFLAGGYIFLECLDAARLMQKGESILTMARYLCTGAAGLVLMVKAFNLQPNELMENCIYAAALASSLFSRMVYRLGGNRFTDKRYHQ